jgi:putative ABC transport system permease protein
MAVPLIYNVRSVRARWVSAIVAVLGIAGTVGVFLAMLSLANGFRKTLVSSGAQDNAIIRRAGATSEMDSLVDLDSVRVIQNAPGVFRNSGQPVMSPEVVVIAAFPLKSTGTDANVQVRGTSAGILEVRKNVHIIRGQMFGSGLTELVVGKNAVANYEGFDLGSTLKFGGGIWKVVGIFDAGGSSFDSEVWCDSRVLSQIYNRPANLFQSVTLHMNSEGSFKELRDNLTSDPQLTVQVQREREYYSAESETMTLMITRLGFVVALVMGVGAIFGALNTMYSAVSERSREIATMRAIGFGAGSIVTSFVFEALLIALVGGALGCLAVLPINGLATSTMNFQTFSHVAFAFQVTPEILMIGIVFSLLMGLVGGVPPAIRAARRPVAHALRDL